METPKDIKDIAGELTEKIMNRLAGSQNPSPVFRGLDMATYGQVYSEVYAVLEKALGDGALCRPVSQEVGVGGTD